MIDSATTSSVRARGGSVSSALRRCTGTGLALWLAAAACGEPSQATREAALSSALSSTLSSTLPLPRSSPRSAAGAPTTGTVTLITGDRVTLTASGGQVRAQVQAGPGRDRIGFVIERRGGDTMVVPDDMAPLIAADRLDPALFDITRLLADGDGDDRRDDLPLLVTRQPDLPALHSRMATAGVTVVHTLPALHAMAVRQRKASAGAALASLGDPAALRAATAATSAPKLWLDRRRATLLDRSVPQIGAPAAYARGITGAGVTVAIIDTGIDTTHPDLAGKVVAAADFVGDGLGTADGFGHGTHVASIVAGTGAASGGRFHGVAPDATLINGRVCDQFGGCQDSAILAGIEWAVVTQHAPIVNLSLGAPDEPGIDPIEDAVNQLSAQFGALFVVAAGNDGLPRSIESPGSADAALTVGAVDRDESLAVFSSQGPRIGDRAVKPDLTAPGVGIVAARAAGTALGDVVDDVYVALSGTSMATPHVAGSAALVLQQHPDWTGAQLKDALIGAASPNLALTVYQQGAGRVDADRVTRQTATADPASVSLGIAQFPHDDDPLLTRTVHYTNSGTAPLVLSLDASLAASGQPAVPGMIAVAPATLTVPAGGSADAVVTVDTRGAQPDGLYGGTLTATGGDVRIVTPVGVDREPPSANLTIGVLGRDGQPAASPFLDLNGVGDPGDPAVDVQLFLTASGPTTIRLPLGTYSIVTEDSSDDPAVMIAPRFQVTADASLVVDGRLARPLDLTLPERDLVVADILWDFEDIRMGGGFATGAVSRLAEGTFGPEAGPGEIVSLVNATLVPPGSDSPARIYTVARRQPDHVLVGWQQTLRLRDLAIVEASHAGAGGEQFIKTIAPMSTTPPSLIVSQGFPYAAPFHRTEFYFGDGFVWDAELRQVIPAPGVPGGLELAEALDQVRDYRPGQTYVERWNRAPFGPAFPGDTFLGQLLGLGAATRIGDTLVLMPAMFSDQSTPPRGASSLVAQQHLTLSRDGQVITRRDDTAGQELVFLGVAPDPSLYRLEIDSTRPADAFPLSTHVTAAWTFHSQHADATAVLPVPTLQFLPELDDHNQTAARALVLPIQIQRPAGADAPPIAELRVEASFDGGAHWSPVPTLRLGDRAAGLIVHPPGATAVSLRGRAADVDGNAVEQTIVPAYAVVPR